MKKLKVIQIGIGHDHAVCALDTMLNLKDDFEVAALAPAENESRDFADKVKKYEEKGVKILTPEEALKIEGLDGAVIECEDQNLTKYSLMAVDRGLNIHMDKPGGFVMKDFELLISKLKEKKLVFSTGYMYRHNPKIKEAIEKAKNGELGEVYAVEAHMDCDHPADKRQWLEKFPGGMMSFLGCHLIDLIYRIMGEPDEVIPMNMSTHLDGNTACDYGFALLRYKNGLSFAKVCAAEPGGFIRRQLVICGSKGTIEIKPLEEYDEHYNILTTMRETYSGGTWNDKGTVTVTAPFNRYAPMLLNFAAMVRKEKENEYSYDYELELYKLLMRACGEV